MALLLARLLLSQPAATAQQPGAPIPGYTVMATGWNLIATATATKLDVPSAEPTLYTLLPESDSYQVSGWSSLQTGYGYWALFRENTAVRLPPSTRQNISVEAPAGKWIMVGNPSTSGSARITGADAAFVYSPLSGYRNDTLIPVGYGAFVISDRGGTIYVEAGAGDSPPVDFPSCCKAGNGDYHGRARIEILDDSPFALFYGIRAVSANGSFPKPTSDNYGYGAVPACASCDEYATPPAACRTSAPVRTVDVAPGQYLIRLTADGPRVPDIIRLATLEPDTRYFFCRYVGTVRR